MAQRLLIIADDLTGALDSGSAFAMRGHTTRVLLDAADLPAALADPALSVIAVATGTREGSAADAGAAVARIAAMAQGFDGLILKKIDSRLKGHISAELTALQRAFPLPVLAAPAIPRLGRFVTDGCVTGAGVITPIRIGDVLTLPAIIPDARTDADLDAALPGDLRQMIYAGATGLAEALARALPPGPARDAPGLRLPLLMAIGSRDPVTLAQIDRLATAPLPAPNGAVPELPAGPVVAVQMTPGRAALPCHLAGQEFATGIARQVRRNPPATLFACGGETAHAILRALGIGDLDLLGEILPGLPVARTLQGDLTVLTKSGGFGGPEMLAQLTRKFVNS